MGVRWTPPLGIGCSLADLLTISGEALARYKLRTALSTLGVVLGVSAVIAMMSVSDGARVEALRQVEQLGLNNLIVRNTVAARGARLTMHHAQGLRDLVPQLQSVSPLIERFPVLTGPEGDHPGRVLGVAAEYQQVLDLSVDLGRFLTPVDVRRAARVCVLGRSLSRQLFGYRDPLSARLEVGGEWYVVVGVLASRQSDTGAIGAVAARDLNQAALVPVTALVGHRVAPSSEHHVDEIWIQLRAGAAVVELGDVVEHTLTRLDRGRDTAYDVVIPLELLNQRVQTQRNFSVVVGSVAVLSLLVGGIGIMNIMLTSVLERTREIGLRRSVGATRRGIVAQFLVESLMMTAVGGVAGILLGVASSFAITAYAEWSTHVSTVSILLGFGVSVVVGLGFGIYPATKAARLQPVDAVRYE